jgi:hypothetical protein
VTVDLPAHLTGDDAKAFALGAKVFMRDGHCVTCHQKTGAGLDPIYPPLAGSPWVTGSEERLTKLVLHGLWGPIEVNGKTYDPAKGIPPMTQFAALLKDEFNNSHVVVHLLLRYTQALITQMSQTAVCNRHHSLDQQLCRWLLLSLDRLPGNELVMTQELIANMLGVRREGVTDAALKLQKLGLIRYARGHITVLDRPGLAARTCECYEVVKKEYDRLLPEVASVPHDRIRAPIALGTVRSAPGFVNKRGDLTRGATGGSRLNV